MKFNRVLVLLAALLELSSAARADLAAIFTNVAPAASTVLPRRTSIIVIQCHGLGGGDLSCYGQTNYQTPNLDQLAAEGMRFTGYSAGGAALSPAQAALMTGRAALHLRQRADVEVPLAPDEFNLAQRLQQAGYHTGLIGEWTLGQQPWTQGFDEFAGFLNGNEGTNYYADYLWRYAPHSIFNETNRTFDAFTGREMIYPNLDGKRGQFLPDLFIKAMDNFVNVNQPDFANHYRPFFLLVNLPVPRTATAGQDDFPVPSDAPFSDAVWPQAAKNRAALITRLDAGIGRLREQLVKSGMTNNVAVFFTSSTPPEKFADTNLNFLRPNGDFRDEKNPGTAPLPMIVHWPQHVPAGKVSGLNWAPQDFAPTALEIAFVKPLPKLDGTSILPVLLGLPPVKAENKP